MQFNVRLYKETDYPEVRRWYAATDEGVPSPTIFPLDSTLILEADGIPAFCLIVYLTNCKELCYFEGFIGNPDFQGDDRKVASDAIADAACAFAKTAGYKYGLTFSYRPKVKQRIVQLGFKESLKDLSCFVKELA